jgi:hypothetical protein
VKNGLWRLRRLIVTTLIALIRPPPTLGQLRAASTSLDRHLREPKRQRLFRPVQLC